VLVAAFGGMEFTLFHEAAAKQVHPVIPFICVYILFTIQSFLVLNIGLDLDFGTAVYNSEFGKDDADMVVVVELLLIFIVQLSFYNRMLKCLRCLFFVLNPTTWRDIERPGHQEDVDDSTWSPLLVAPLCIVALIWKFFIQNKVSTLSFSIIFSNARIESAVFDCLAIEFIILLDEIALSFVKVTFDVQMEENAKFKVKREAFTENKSFRRLEGFLAGMCLSFLYLTQFGTVLFALQTNTLPAKRTLCRRWLHMSSGQGDLFSVFRALTFKAWLLIVSVIRNPAPDFTRYADPSLGGVCKEGDYDPMDVFTVLPSYPKSTAFFCMLVLTLLFLPPVLRCSNMGRQKDEGSLDARGTEIANMINDVEDEQVREIMLLMSGQIQELKSKSSGAPRIGLLGMFGK